MMLALTLQTSSYGPGEQFIQKDRGKRKQEDTTNPTTGEGGIRDKLIGAYKPYLHRKAICYATEES